MKFIKKLEIDKPLSFNCSKILKIIFSGYTDTNVKIKINAILITRNCNLAAFNCSKDNIAIPDI
jgi:hypothetical protein